MVERCKNITTRCGSMLELGMWVPRQSRDRIRTLHACVLGDCLINDVYSCECLMNGVYTMLYVL